MRVEYARYNSEDSDLEPFWPAHGTELPKQPCMIEEFFRREQEKPANQRARSCMISCPCPKCRPMM